MGYHVFLMCPCCQNFMQVREHWNGATINVYGNSKAEMDITYNYREHFVRELDAEGIRWLYGKPAKDTVNRLEKAIAALGTERADDYWEATPGNAGYALSILLGWARLHPEAEWGGD